MAKNVYLFFKTHLDIGFTDFAENVKRQYIETYIPNAIKIGYELKDSETPFVWTTGSWIISEALKEDDGTLDKAIRDGIIRWHGLPFTTHTELMSPYVFEASLKIKDELDSRFGVATHSAKMTDVPGHTKGMIPLLAKHGIKIMHIGVNRATPVPNVPKAFIWRHEDSEITVLYHGGGYGGEIVSGDNVFIFAHTNDNTGPQSADEIREIYSEVRKSYPDAKITASSLEILAEKFDSSSLPVVTEEIGDTWIHGVETDPWRTAAFKAVQREVEKKEKPVSVDLMSVAEHTWGLDTKRHYPDKENYLLSDFEKNPSDPARLKMEASWEEQRDYVRRAAKETGMDIEKEMKVTLPDLTGAEETEKTPSFKVIWQLFNADNYEHYKKVYVQIPDDWAIDDFTKPNLPDYEAMTVEAEVNKAYKKGNSFIYELSFPKEIEEKHGLPHFYAVENGEDFELISLGKKPNRLPQALWLKFNGFEGKAEVNKMGTWIDPAEALGSPLITAFDKGVRNETKEIISLDTSLAAPFGMHLLDYNIADLKPDLHFNLYNNIWNTNFMMWYSDDIKYRFKIKER